MTKITKCEICEEEKPLIRYSAMMVCAQCMQKEIQAQKEIEATADERVAKMNQDMRERLEDTLARQIEVDTSIEVDTDLFNAETVSIVDMKAAIDADDSIENKTLELFTRLKARHDRFQERIFARNKANTAEATAQRSIQQYFNEFAGKLRDEEREKLRLQDLTYKPKPAPKPKKAKTPKKKKYDREVLARIAEQTGIAASTVQAMCIALNKNPEDIPAHIEQMKSGQ